MKPDAKRSEIDHPPSVARIGREIVHSVQAAATEQIEKRSDDLLEVAEAWTNKFVRRAIQAALGGFGVILIIQGGIPLLAEALDVDVKWIYLTAGAITIAGAASVPKKNWVDLY